MAYLFKGQLHQLMEMVYLFKGQSNLMEMAYLFKAQSSQLMEMVFWLLNPMTTPALRAWSHCVATHNRMLSRVVLELVQLTQVIRVLIITPL